MIVMGVGNENSPQPVYMVEFDKSVAHGNVCTYFGTFHILDHGRPCNMSVKKDLVFAIIKQLIMVKVPQMREKKNAPEQNQ